MNNLIIIISLVISMLACSNPVSNDITEEIELTGMVIGFEEQSMLFDTYDKVYNIEIGEIRIKFPPNEITILVRREGDKYYLIHNT